MRTRTRPAATGPAGAGLLAAAAALAALGVAYWAQDFRSMVPCPLCLWERWPYRVVAVLGVVASLLPRRPGRVALALAVPVLLAGVAVALLHVGVEHGWWPSPLPECNGILTPGSGLPAVPAVPCDRPVFLLKALPISFATLDAIYEVVFALAVLIYVVRRPRRFR